LNGPAQEYCAYQLQQSLDETGLTNNGWRYKITWLPATVTGACLFDQQLIFINSTTLPSDGFVPHVADVTAHELSHALCGPDAGHGETWRSTCIELGGSGDRRALPPTEGNFSMSLQRNINQHYVDAISSLSHCEHVEADKLQQRWERQEIDAAVCASCGEPSASQVLYGTHPMLGGEHVAQNLLPACWKCSGTGLS
jgi:hypothetical protein